MSVQQKHNILLVDDDKAILSSFRGLLLPRGFNVDTAETGREAIAMCNAKHYSLAIIDIKLPDMEGTELLAKLQGDQPKTKKIMITGYPTMTNAINSVNLQADAYLVKPVRPEEFLRKVEEKIREELEDERIDEAKVMYWVEERYRRMKEKSRRPEARARRTRVSRPLKSL